MLCVWMDRERGGRERGEMMTARLRASDRVVFIAQGQGREELCVLSLLTLTYVYFYSFMVYGCMETPNWGCIIYYIYSNSYFSA
jgi:hypothetical protein